MLKGLIFRGVLLQIASHADVLKGSLLVPAPLTRDEPLRMSAWEAMLQSNSAHDRLGLKCWREKFVTK